MATLFTREYNNTKYGWITQSGKIIETDLYGHLGVISNNFKEFNVSNFQNRLNEIESIQIECSERIESGEHPEWHIYEMAKDDLTWKIINAVFDAGNLRFGQRESTIYFEGKSEAIKNLCQKAKDFAEELECCACFEARK